MISHFIVDMSSLSFLPVLSCANYSLYCQNASVCVCVCVCACVRDFSYISQTYSLIKRVPNETTCCIEYKMVDLLSKSESAGYINGQCVLNGTPRHPLKKKTCHRSPSGFKDSVYMQECRSQFRLMDINRVFWTFSMAVCEEPIVNRRLNIKARPALFIFVFCSKMPLCNDFILQ